MQHQIPVEHGHISLKQIADIITRGKGGLSTLPGHIINICTYICFAYSYANICNHNVFHNTEKAVSKKSGKSCVRPSVFINNSLIVEQAEQTGTVTGITYHQECWWNTQYDYSETKLKRKEEITIVNIIWNFGENGTSCWEINDQFLASFILSTAKSLQGLLRQ